MYHDWRVKNAIVNLPTRLKTNSKHISGNLYSPLGVQNKKIGTALQTLLTGVRFYAWHRLYNPYNVPPYYGHLLRTFVSFSLVSVQERLYRSLLTLFAYLVWLYRCPSLNIPGFTHSVMEYFLPDVHKMLGGRGMSSMPGPPQNKRFKPNNSSAKVFCTFYSTFLLQCRYKLLLSRWLWLCLHPMKFLHVSRFCHEAIQAFKINILQSLRFLITKTC